MAVREKFLFALLIAALPASATGKPDHSVSANLGASSHSVTVVDSAGHPFVAWQDGTHAGLQIYVRRLQGRRWIEVGAGSASGTGISRSTGKAAGPAMALDGQGRPIVAWHDSAAGIDQIRVRRFNGTRWVGLGAESTHPWGISRSPVASRYPSVAIDAQGHPIVAWQEFLSAGSFSIFVKRFDGTRWVELGAGSASADGMSNGWDSSRPSLAIDAQGRPVLAWQEYSTVKLRYEIYVRRFDGQVWQEVGAGSASSGGISNSPGESARPQLVADAAGNLVVAWHDDSQITAKPQIYVKRFDGTAWHPLGPKAASGKGISHTDDPSRSPSVILDRRGHPVVAWYVRQGLSKREELHVKQYDGQRWRRLATNSAAGARGGAGLGRASSPSVTVDGQGRPMLSWHESRDGNGQVYLKRFDGADWRPVGRVLTATTIRTTVPAPRVATPQASAPASQPPLEQARLALLVPVDHTQAKPLVGSLPAAREVPRSGDDLAQ